MGNKAQEYKEPGKDASYKEREHYDIVAPILDTRREYRIEAEEIRYELENITGESFKLARVKSWFRVKTDQKWTPPFRVIRAMNQVFLNILTKKGYKFSKGSRLYYEIANPFEKTAFEEEIIAQNLKFRHEISELKNKIKMMEAKEVISGG